MNEVTTSVLGARAVIDARVEADARARGADMRARGAYARAEALVPPGPVRAIDPVRPRFSEVDGGKAAETAEAASPSVEAETRAEASERTAADGAQTARGPGLLGALTNFLARVFGQSGEADSVAPSAVLSGLRAYAPGAAAMAGDPAGVEISSPGFPRLSSGRALDLTV